ncbi:vacuolar protein sorting-associated protein 16 homolog [Haliotis cracherodii]|uniref:vacuolar protein sorting-associated protein 16 homolog n=1 Tax=Haliotis cracherodii TaxID=6455 RepID=UPI0039E73224
MATADWSPLGTIYYRKCELYTMEWSGLVDLSKCTVAAAPYGGPIALMRDESKSGRVTTNVKPIISVYNTAGKLLSQLRWNSGHVIQIGWTVTEELLCVQDDGVVLVYDIFLNFKRTFGMGQEAKDVKLLDCKIFNSFQGTGIAVMTTAFRIFLITNAEDPRVRKLAEVPGLNSLPSSWTIINIERKSLALVAKNDQLFLVDHGGQYQEQSPEVESEVEAYVGMALSFNNKYLALFTQTGMIWIGSSDLQKCYCEFNTKSKSPPNQLAWCGNGAVVAMWDRLMVVVGPDKDWIKYNFDSPVSLVQEEDGLRIFGDDIHEFLQKVPAVTEQIFKIGSMEPGAMLFEASREFQKRSQKADEYVRMIKDKLDIAVDQCIEAAGNEIEPNKQRLLLRAASFGKCFLTDYRPEAFVNMCQMLRVLNQVRHHSVGIPLTYVQLEHLSMSVLIDRLVLRKFFCLAIKICQYLKIPDAEGTSRILAHWACYKVQQKHEEEDTLAKAISQKLLDVPGVSFSEIASQALDQGRKQLAIKLLEYEPKASEQVPLLLKMDQDHTALGKAIDSGDSDLVYTVLLRLKEKLQSSGDFLMTIRTMPIAYSLYIQFCKQQNPKLVEDLYYQEDNFLDNGNCKVVRSFQEEMLDDRLKRLEDAQNCYSRAKNDFAAKQTEDQIKLLKFQRRLEEEHNKPYVDLSLHQTIYKLTVEQINKPAEQLRKEFKVPEKRYWLLRINALAEAGDWGELEKFSRTKKPPVGMEVFVEACVKLHNKQEAHRYMNRVTPDKKVKCLIKLGNLKAAAEAAFENRNEDELNSVLSRVSLADKQLAESIRAMRNELGKK